MVADVSLACAWDDPGGHDGFARRDPGTDVVLIRGGRARPACVNLRRSAAEDRRHAPDGDPRHVPGALVLRRAGRDAPPAVDEHLVAGPGENSWPWLSCADVIVRRIGDPMRDAVLTSCLASLPGCLIAVGNTRGGACLVAVRGWRARLTPVRGGACTDEEAMSYASALHLWIISGRPLDALAMARLTVVRGRAAVPAGVRVTVREFRGTGDGRPVADQEAVRRAAH